MIDAISDDSTRCRMRGGIRRRGISLKGQGMMFPKKRWSQPDESKTMVAECPESLMQEAVDEYLAIKRMKNYRIPDGFFRWIKMKAPAGIQKWFFGVFGKQKREGEECKVCRSVDDAIAEIDKFEKIAEEYKKLLTP